MKAALSHFDFPTPIPITQASSSLLSYLKIYHIQRDTWKYYGAMQIDPVANSITKTLAISDKICVVVNTALHLKLWCLYMQSTILEPFKPILLRLVLLHLL